MIEVGCNDHLGKKVRLKHRAADTSRDLKNLIIAQSSTHWNKVILKKWFMVFMDCVSLGDYDEMNLGALLPVGRNSSSLPFPLLPLSTPTLA